MPSSDDALRLGCFATVFAAMAVWELSSAQRVLTVGRVQRWSTNVAMLVLGLAIVRVAMPLTLTGSAQ